MNRADKRRREAQARQAGVDPFTAQIEMAGAQFNAGQFGQAAKLCDAILAKSGAHGPALFLGGLSRLRLGDAVSASRMLARAGQIMPKHAQTFAQLGSARIALKDIDGAAQAYEAAVAADPEFADAIAQLGMIASWRGNDDASDRHFDRAIELAPSNPAILLNAANARLRRGDAETAADLYRRVLTIRSDVTEAHFGLGQALRDLGDIDGAIENYLEAMRRGPHPNAVLSLTLTPYGFTDADFARLQAAYDLAPAGTDARMLCGFAIAKVLGDRQRHEEAFQALEEANAIRRGRAPFDAAKAHAELAETAAMMDTGFFAGRAGWGVQSDAPIFIVGLPRSGSTLIEQILAGHPSVAGGGELPDFPASLADVAGGNLGDGLAARVAALSAADAARIGETYLARTAQLRGDRPHHTDKLLGNFTLLGAIRIALPNARIVHCTRDWADMGFSIFRTFFPHGGHDYAYGLEDLAAYHRDYRMLMAHWQSAFGDAIIEANYEAFVRDIEGETRRLLDRLGLPFDAACLDFHKTRRVVRTASAAQVRRPLYSSAIGAWKPYAQWLAPMLHGADNA